MKALTLLFFAEFAAVALVAPALTLYARTVRGKLLLVCGPLLVLAAPLLAAIRIWLPAQSWLTVLSLQFLAVVFGLAVAGVAALASRRWMWGGPVAVSLLALLVLATPFWGDLLLDLDSEAVRSAAASWLVAVNPLFTVDARLPDDQFDWMQSRVMYDERYGGHKLTRLGETSGYASTPVGRLTLWYPLVGLTAAAVAGLVRQKGRPSEYLVQSDRFC